MQKLGQHFLHNAAVLKKIVSAVELADGDHIIEIGPGHGELTLPLLASHKKDLTLVCIEKDQALVEELELLAAKERAGGREVTIVEGDALKLLPELAASDYKIVGNIPYYITGKLLRVISELEQKPRRTVLLIQKEVAERICAVPPGMNRLAASVQFWADPTIISTVPQGDFSPPPKVDSAVILLKRKSAPPSVDPELYYKTVRTVFAQPRKTLLNNLIASKDGMTKEGATKLLSKIDIDPTVRGQDLGIEAIIAIANAGLWG